MRQLLLTIFLAGSALISFAGDYYTAVTNLNVRAGEGTYFLVSFKLQKGTEVEVLSTHGEWSKIEYLGKFGHVNSRYLQYSRSNPINRAVLYSIAGVCVVLLFYVFYGLGKKIRSNNLLQTVTEKTRGEKTERDLVLQLVQYGIDSQTIFHDLYVDTSKGGFSQIDLVAVTKVGIFVFEVKDYSGWIFGTANQSQWTQVLAFGEQKYRFYNPIMQNNRHITELKKQLVQFGNIPFYSVIVFYGDCVLREINYVPRGTFLVKSNRVLDCLEQILEQNAPVHYSNESEIFRILQQAVINGGISENKVRHKENIEEMLGKHRIFE